MLEGLCGLWFIGQPHWDEIRSFSGIAALQAKAKAGSRKKKRATEEICKISEQYEAIIRFHAASRVHARHGCFVVAWF